jgi:hypothetical protein
MSVADPIARAVTPEQALLDMALIHEYRRPKTNADWFDEQTLAWEQEESANAAAKQAEDAAIRDQPGNHDEEAAMARLMELVGRPITTDQQATFEPQDEWAIFEPVDVEESP